MKCNHHWTVTSECPKCLRTEVDKLRTEVSLLSEAGRIVAERQREACAEAVKRFWGVGDHNAEVQACRATPLVTDGDK